MARFWPQDTKFTTRSLKFNESRCDRCGHHLYISKNRPRKIYTFDGPLLLDRERAKCSNCECEKSKKWFVTREEQSLTMLRWKIGWDIFLWMGFRRCKRHWSVTKIRNELSDSYEVKLSEDAIEDYLQLYQVMVAEKHQDIDCLKEIYNDVEEVDLTIDGLQPEKGHETLYVVRDLTKGRVLFAQPLISSSNEEVRQLFKRAKTLCEQMKVKVRCWMTDKQGAFLYGIKKEFPDAIHRYCQNHFLRDLATPMTEIDSKAKVEMRKKVRGLRTLEKEVIEEQKSEKLNDIEAGVVLDYCTAIKGILNDGKGGPLSPSGLRMYEGLQEVYDSLGLNLAQEGTTKIDEKLERLQDCIERGMHVYDQSKDEIKSLLEIITEVNGLLDFSQGSSKSRQSKFHRRADKLSKRKKSNLKKMGKLMLRFEPGLFSGGERTDLPTDNLDLERWFKTPKGHQRRLNGRKHVGTRIVYEGETLIPALDAHLNMTRPLKPDELIKYQNARPPKSQVEGLRRRRIMSQASSKKKE